MTKDKFNRRRRAVAFLRAVNIVGIVVGLMAVVAIGANYAYMPPRHSDEVEHLEKTISDLKTKLSQCQRQETLTIFCPICVKPIQ